MNETNTQTNGYEYIKENANTKQAVMQVYHGESVETENKAHTEAKTKNTSKF